MKRSPVERSFVMGLIFVGGTFAALWGAGKTAGHCCSQRHAERFAAADSRHLPELHVVHLGEHA